MLFWLSQVTPQRLLLDWGLIKVHWYGLLVALAITVSLIVVSQLAKLKKIETAKLWDLFFYLVIFGFLGARIYYVLFYNLHYFINYPLAIFKIWEGGLAIQGAIFSGLIVIYLFTKKQRLNRWVYLDLVAVVLPLGQAIGRWGNYFNQELFGLPCNFFWCIPIEAVNRPEQYLNFQHFHPVFLYEAIFNLILFVVLIILFKSTKWPAGLITFGYLIGYSLIRFFLEFIRLDVTAIFFGLKWVQWLCLAVIIITFLYWRLRFKKATSEPLTF